MLFESKQWHVSETKITLTEYFHILYKTRTTVAVHGENDLIHCSSCKVVVTSLHPLFVGKIVLSDVIYSEV